MNNPRTTTKKIMCFVFRRDDGSIKGHLKLTFEPGARHVAIKEFRRHYIENGGVQVNEKTYNKIVREYAATQLINSQGETA